MPAVEERKAPVSRGSAGIAGAPKPWDHTPCSLSRVEWVRGQSRATRETLGQSPAVRNALLREHGKTAFHQRFTPLRADP
jgi:hypothetical protein